MLPLGARFDAVRIPASIMIAGVGSEEELQISGFLAETIAGPILCDPGIWYYALVPAGTAEMWISQRVSCLGAGHWLAVPAVNQGTGPGPHWSVPMERAGALCRMRPLEEFTAAAGRQLYRQQRPVTT
jgi:hypothetical protein